MDLGLQGKSVLVTAASKGLGKATAQRFAAEGARVVIASRNAEALEKAKNEIVSQTGNSDVAFVVCDMTRAEDIKRLVESAVERNGTIDVLINNAGGPPAGGFDQFSDEDWQKAFELNLLSFVRTIREVLPYMRKQRSGRIVNFTSSSIKQPIDHLILSNTFRVAVTGLAKTLASELAKDNILINTLGPGRIATDRVAQLDRLRAEQLNLSSEEVRASFEKAIPLGRYGEAEEFAKAAVFFASWANTYITGQTLLVDGGMVKAL
jgi:3-oxoacyl-[acyl-carrier protein] reductase